MAEQIDAKFDSQLRKLAEQMKAEGNAILSASLGEWMIGNTDQWNGDPFDIANLGKGFDREGLIEAYTKNVANPVGVKGGEFAALRLQYEILLAGERAFRLRHASEVRSEMFAASREKGLGEKGLVKMTIDHMQSVLKAAQA